MTSEDGAVRSGWGLAGAIFGLVLLCSGVFLAVRWVWGPIAAASVLGIMLLLFGALLSLAWLEATSSRLRPADALDRRLGTALDELIREDFAVLHGVRFGDQVLEHLVVGAPGVFLVVTEATPGQGPQQRLEQARRGADRLAERVAAQIGLLVVSEGPPGADYLPGVPVVQVSEVTDYFRSRQQEGGARSETVQRTVRAIFRAAQEGGSLEDRSTA